ncbi:hypothetical protein MC885_019837 [Smutsia gigantea]|nr:hypothetical protein MC885_019837 [Smutsia gigantea]
MRVLAKDEMRVVGVRVSGVSGRRLARLGWQGTLSSAGRAPGLVWAHGGRQGEAGALLPPTLPPPRARRRGGGGPGQAAAAAVAERGSVAAAVMAGGGGAEAAARGRASRPEP